MAIVSATESKTSSLGAYVVSSISEALPGMSEQDATIGCILVMLLELTNFDNNY